jgi:hypothetical protein
MWGENKCCMMSAHTNSVIHITSSSVLSMRHSSRCGTTTNSFRNIQCSLLALCPYMRVIVRGHPSVSLLSLSSPTLHLFICIPPPHLCTSSKDCTSSQQLPGPIVQWLPRSRLTNSRWFPTSHSTHTLDKPRTHWDRSAWCYGTLRHHVDSHIWEAWY